MLIFKRNNIPDSFHFKLLKKKVAFDMEGVAVPDNCWSVQ